ncbi:hypothetical protein ACIA6C_27820 [Streptomyces sp. NPDC051578]|uniref:hypothetical protein n=1 Tax=Streptomyces sp. NPDC051578 TaxID=3365662 RepID=UPI003792ADC8
MATDRLAEIAESHPGDWYSGEWRTEYVEGRSDEPSCYVVKHQESGTVLAELPDWAGPIALFIADAHDAVPELVAEVRSLNDETSKLANIIAGTGLALWEEERDTARLRLAWQSARQRAAAYGEGILRVVRDREAWEGWTKSAEAEVVRLRTVLAERDEQIAYLIAAEPTLDDDQPGAPQ